MVVKKNLRRSNKPKNKKQNSPPTHSTKELVLTAEFDSLVHENKERNQATICNRQMTQGLEKLKVVKATLAQQEVNWSSQTLSRLPESFHQSRSVAVSNIRCLHVFYDGGADTFALSVGILDGFLSSVKVKDQHLSCAAAACYFIATKIHEEEEDLPSGSGLCQLHGKRWKLNDLCRMESAILRKLNWKLPLATYLTYINHFLEILHDNYPGIRALCSVERMVEIAEKYLRFGYSKFFKPSSVAVCVLYQYLSEADLLDSVMSVFILKLQSICAITDSEMFECGQVVATAEKSVPEINAKSQRITNSIFYKIRSRPSYDGETDLPTIIEDNTQED